QARKAGNAVDVSHGLHLANACGLGSASIGARPWCITNEAAEVAVWLTAVTRLACDGEGDLHAPSNPLRTEKTKRRICPPVGESNAREWLNTSVLEARSVKAGGR
ncbi:uncharacterized protein BO88DRAFT_347302, partial [Aspergillus vadensis CBS 113365]